MKLLVDMNLSPSWVERLAQHGFEAVHWSTIGAATAPDTEILAYAHRHNLVLITNDLDFSAILAATAVDGPSVVQVRSQDLLSDSAVSIVARALEAHREDPFFAPRPVRRGSLAPRLHVGRPAEPRSVRDAAECAAHVVREICAEVIGRNTPVRFSPETAFIVVNAHSPRINA